MSESQRQGGFVPQPRQRELSYWLSDEAARYAPDGVATALRSMAGNRGQRRGLAAAAVGAGAAFTGLGILGWATSGSPGFLIGLSGPGMVLALIEVLMFRRLQRHRPPKVFEMLPSRGPGNFKSGLLTAIFFTVVFGAIFSPLSGRLLERSPEGVVLLAGYAVMVMMFFVSVFAAPAYFIEHAARDFRAEIESSPELRRTLEEMSLTWTDPVGTREFGPL